MHKCLRNTEPGVTGSGGGRTIPSPVQSLAGHTLGIPQKTELSVEHSSVPQGFQIRH